MARSVQEVADHVYVSYDDVTHERRWQTGIHSWGWRTNGLYRVTGSGAEETWRPVPDVKAMTLNEAVYWTMGCNYVLVNHP